MECNTAVKGNKQNAAKSKGKGKGQQVGKANGKGGMKSPAKIQRELEVLQKKYEELAAKYPGAGKGGKSDKGGLDWQEPPVQVRQQFPQEDRAPQGRAGEVRALVPRWRSMEKAT